MCKPSEWLGEVNLWAEPIQAERVAFLRGPFITNFSHVEQAIAALCIRASSLPQYGDLRPDLPFIASDRLTYLREVAAAPGPLLRWGTLITAFLDRMTKLAPTRHRMAHGYMRIIGRPSGLVQFREITKRKARDPLASEPRLSMDELERLVRRSARLSRLCQRLVQKVDERELLPALASGEPFGEPPSWG